MRSFDIVTVAPNDLDFPMYRNNIRKFAKYATSINYVVSYNSHSKGGDDWYDCYLDTIKRDIPFCNFVSADYCEAEHWYDHAMNIAVKQCKSDYVLFIEPDLDIDADELFSNQNVFDYDVITIPTKPEEHHRLWPAFFMTKLELINKTRLQFNEGINDVWNMVILDESTNQLIFKQIKNDNISVDNFDKFTNDIIDQTKSVVFTNMLGVSHFNYTHICWNWRWCREGEYGNIHKPQRFANYLKRSIGYDVMYDDRYIDECERYIEQINNRYGVVGDMSDGR